MRRNRKSINHAVCDSFRLSQNDKCDQRDVDKQFKRTQCAFKRFWINYIKAEHENKHNKKIL